MSWCLLSLGGGNIILIKFGDIYNNKKNVYLTICLIVTILVIYITI